MSDTLTLEDIEAVKARQQATWSSGDYAVIGTTLQIVGESLCEAVDVHAGSQVLDVAAGNGNASLAAARRRCDVTATDYVDALLDRARIRAEAEGLPLTTQTADAENLPFADSSFDTVLSTFGVMFTPNHERPRASCCEYAGQVDSVGLANWTPEGFVGSMFKIIGGHVPPPTGVPSPLQWGNEDRVRELLGAHADVKITRKHFTFRYRTPVDFFETFITYYGPTVKAWAALDEAGRESLRSALVDLAASSNRNTDGTLAAESEYLEIVATRNDQPV